MAAWWTGCKLGEIGGRDPLQITVNGQTTELGPETTVAQLLTHLEMQPRYVAVERNLDLVPRSEHAGCVLEDGDRLEVVTLVGGG